MYGCYPNTSIPQGDIAAWENHLWTRPWFNKLHVANCQELACGPHGIYPDRFPVISRPTYNMDGMSAGAEIWNGPNDVTYKPGYFWSEIIEGDHVSWDLLIENGKVVRSYAAFGHKMSLSKFSHWEIWKASLPAFHCNSFVSRNFFSKSGKVNLECIGDKIIEVHFRWCPEWEHWYDRVPFYSVPLWEDSDGWQDMQADSGDTWELIPDPVPGLVSPRRLAVVLCKDLKVIQEHPIYKRYVG